MNMKKKEELVNACKQLIAEIKKYGPNQPLCDTNIHFEAKKLLATVKAITSKK
jgi:hypothetical protein